MTQIELNRTNDVKSADTGWKGICRLGAAAALTAVLLVLLDITISMGGGEVNPDTLTAAGWFKVYRDNSLAGLRMLGLLNIISLTICIPLYFALYTVHRQVCRNGATLALILYLVGTAVYISNNAAVPMYVLSSKYMTATADAQRVILAAAGEAIIAKGADFTPGSFIGFFFTEIAGLAFSFIMLYGRIFGRAAAYFGILGFVFLTAFTVCLTFAPEFYNVAMIIAMIGGLSSLAWYISVARKLLQLGSGIQVKSEGGLI